jgi:23S rRNA (uracil1939-C5)-methyltransferase
MSNFSWRRFMATKTRPRPLLVDLEVESVGARGDGVARQGGNTVYLPGTLSGDLVRARVLGERGEVLSFTRKAARREPDCRHFGRCGGCALQHMPEEDYRDWKRAQVVEALAKKGFREVPLAPLQMSPAGSRRRTTLAFERQGGQVRLGYHGRRSHELVDIVECPVVTQGIAALLGPLRVLLAKLPVRAGKAVVVEAESGLDLLLTGLSAPDLAVREALARFAGEADLARLSIGDDDLPETVIERRPVFVTMGGKTAPLAPGGFLQATKEGEAVLLGAVLEWVRGRGVADLFAGCGTFSLPLAAKGHKVAAFELDGALLASLERGAGGRIDARGRDLFQAPLAVDELAAFDTVVIDPPRAGARAQAEALARSSVGTVIAISCNPSTFARDARILVDGGYALLEIRPVDQFLWSPHIELAALFRREGA